MPNPTILAIDTSCDDTAAAVTQGTTVLSNVIASQTELHKPYGGVFPTVAKQAHKENIAATVSLALRRAHMQLGAVDAIAVTQGPGLAPALEVGIEYALDLGAKNDIPLYAANHLEGHLLSVLAQPNTNRPSQEPVFPVLGCIMSGGNSTFVLVHAVGNYQILGKKLDDAAGECLDKIGRMLGLGYPAGAVIEQFAKLGDASKHQFPLPLTSVKSFDLSFSGLKTHARKHIEQLTARQPDGILTKQMIYDLCAATQAGVFRHITYKLEKILQTHQVSEIWLGGGVAANATLRSALRSSAKKVYGQAIPLRVPYTKRLCMDNAAMIGVTTGLLIENNQIQPTKHIDRVPRLQLPERMERLV